MFQTLTELPEGIDKDVCVKYLVRGTTNCLTTEVIDTTGDVQAQLQAIEATLAPLGTVQFMGFDYL